jgi:hypothetical protein
MEKLLKNAKANVLLIGLIVLWDSKIVKNNVFVLADTNDQDQSAFQKYGYVNRILDIVIRIRVVIMESPIDGAGAVTVLLVTL